MKILISIILNALILFALSFFLSGNEAKGVSEWIEVTWWVSAFLVWGFVLWIINVTIKPVLKIFSLPLFFLFFGLVSVLINWIILFLLDHIINNILKIPWVSYKLYWEEFSIDWWINFIIAIAIFSVLNMIYSLLFNKK